MLAAEKKHLKYIYYKCRRNATNLINKLFFIFFSSSPCEFITVNWKIFPFDESVNYLGGKELQGEKGLKTKAVVLKSKSDVKK